MRRVAALVLFLAAAKLSAQTCTPSPTRLCLSAGRFAAQVSWQDAQSNTGVGTGVSLSADTGYFWFFNAANVELVVKVLDARALNGHFWVFYGALSNVQYTLTVTDTSNGQVKTYTNPQGTFGSVGDTNAFPLSSGSVASSHTERSGVMFNLGGRFEFPAAASQLALDCQVPEAASEMEPEVALAAAAPCPVEATSLYLSSCRFRLSVSWKDFQGNTGSGQAVSLTADTGYFWFFNAANVELVAKVLDARALNGSFWVFYGALSNVEYEITVTDTTTGVVKRYLNPAQHFGSTGDTGAFPPVAAPPPSSEELIDVDLKAGKITEEQALVYRLYVAFGSPSLPAPYRSTVSPGIDLPVVKTVTKRYPTLSPAAQAAVAPYLVPPVYPGSWGDPAFVASIQSGSQLESMPRVPARATDVCIQGRGPLFGWGHKDTDHFKVWYRTVIGPNFYYSLAETETAATNVAAVAEHVYATLNANFHIVPLSDVNEGCNGGDGAIDIYMDKMGFGALAQTVTYTPGCAARPTWMWINPLAIQDSKIARDVFAHEYMHMIECFYSRGGDCDDYSWLEEASANWAVDYVYCSDQFEQGDAGFYYGGDDGIPIEKTCCWGRNGYEDYVFPFYLSHKLGPQTIKRIWEFAQLYNPFDSLDNATEGAGGLKKVWPDFTTAGWNDWQGKVADEFYKWDALSWGEKRSFDEHPGSAMSIDMKGLSEKIFDLSDFFTGGGSAFHVIEPLSARYVYLKFPDTSARYVIFHNKPADLAPSKPHLHIRALMKIDGQWKEEKDWTKSPFNTFCRDARAERLEELVVIYSNSDPNRPGFDSDGNDASRISLESADRTSNAFVPTVEISNVGCWQWTGNASVTTDNVAGFTTVESARATFNRFRFPETVPEDYVGFDAFKSDNTGTATFSADGPLIGTSCTLSESGTGPLQGDGALLADAGFIVSFYFPGQVTNRTAIGSGTTNIPDVRSTITCPPNPPERSIVSKDVRWLKFPDPGASVSPDGLLISGHMEWTDSDGDHQSVWLLRAVREE